MKVRSMRQACNAQDSFQFTLVGTSCGRCEIWSTSAEGISEAIESASSFAWRSGYYRVGRVMKQTTIGCTYLDDIGTVWIVAQQQQRLLTP